MILFIKPEDFKDRVPLSQTVDGDYLLPYIRAVQVEIIEPLLGTDMYEKFYQEVVDNTPSVELLMLYPYLTDVHVAYAFVRYLAEAKYRLTDYGHVVKNASESQPIEDEQVGRLVAQWKSVADTYAARMIRFLIRNKDKYSKWSQCVLNSYIETFTGVGVIKIGKNLADKRISVIQEEKIKETNINLMIKDAVSFYYKKLGIII